jgi:hypothetical protein
MDYFLIIILPVIAIALIVESVAFLRKKTNDRGLISAPLGLIDDKFKFKAIKQSLASDISMQANQSLENLNGPKPIYDEDVEIIIRDGKYFYLHEPSDANVAF